MKYKFIAAYKVIGVTPGDIQAVVPLSVSIFDLFLAFRYRPAIDIATQCFACNGRQGRHLGRSGRYML